MAEFAPRSPAVSPPVARASSPAAGPLDHAPRVQRLLQRAAALNAGAAPIQLNGKGGDKKKPNNKNQAKKKAAVEGRKKGKEKKITKIKNSMRGYNESDLTEAELDKAIRGGNLSKMRTGHLSKNKTKNMNPGTVKTLAGLTKTAKDNRNKERKNAKSDDEYEADEDEYGDDFDYVDTPKPSYRKDDDDQPPPMGGEISAY